MPTVEELSREVRTLRERLSRLSEASLRISESLDVDTVLREVVERACALTGAGCGAITTTDASGVLQEFVTAGLSPEEHRRFLELPEGPASSSESASSWPASPADGRLPRDRTS